MSRSVVSVGFGERCVGGLLRLDRRLGELGESLSSWYSQLPSGCPSHDQIPYGFKIWALESTAEWATTLLWLDSTVIVLKPLTELWQLIERQGYWLSRNHGFMNGEFTADAALPILGVSREENWLIPHVVATCFGLDMRNEIAREFLHQWKEAALAGAFAGPKRNDYGEASADPRVKGHRHDQTAASVVAHRLEMKLTTPPEWFSDDGFPSDERTVLTNKRC